MNLLFIGVWGKVLYEQVFGASADVEVMINASVAIDAHFRLCFRSLSANLPSKTLMGTSRPLDQAKATGGR